jgi:hypothetical protein
MVAMAKSFTVTLTKTPTYFTPILVKVEFCIMPSPKSLTSLTMIVILQFYIQKINSQHKMSKL